MNRATVLTGGGSGAIAVIRIAGAAVAQFIEECFDRTVEPGRCVYGRIRDQSQVIDDAVVVLIDFQHADLNVHGSPWIVRKLLALLEARGFEIVQWTPEQTWAMDGQSEIDREIAAGLALARTDLAVRILLEQKNAWANLLNSIPSHAEAQRMLSDRSLHWLLHSPGVAIVGIANAGKSTIANQLFGQERSITADIPGTTRDWVGELANIDGLVVKLMDTPGLRRSADEIEQRAITASQSIITTADLIVLVLDPTQNRAAQQELIDRWLRAIRVINKSDLADYPGAGVRTVATTGTGIDSLRRQILEYFGILQIDELRARCWTSRHRAIAQEWCRS